MIAVNPKDPTDKWLIAEAFFCANYTAAREACTTCGRLTAGDNPVGTARCAMCNSAHARADDEARP